MRFEIRHGQALKLRNDEAYETARRLAAHLKTSGTAAVETALRHHARSVLPEVPPEGAAETYRLLTELRREISKHVRPGAGSDHHDFYDDKGLPA